MLKEFLNYVYNLTEEQSLGFQLTQAAQVLSKYKLNENDKWSYPNNWDENIWVGLCSLSYNDRLSVCSELNIIELTRYELIDEEKIEKLYGQKKKKNND